eukprot:1634039-Rhodomonas_salina.2
MSDFAQGWSLCVKHHLLICSAHLFDDVLVIVSINVLIMFEQWKKCFIKLHVTCRQDFVEARTEYKPCFLVVSRAKADKDS